MFGQAKDILSRILCEVLGSHGVEEHDRRSDQIQKQHYFGAIDVKTDLSKIVGESKQQERWHAVCDEWIQSFSHVDDAAKDRTKQHISGYVYAFKEKGQCHVRVSSLPQHGEDGCIKDVANFEKPENRTFDA
jgi:hypothetical protein